MEALHSPEGIALTAGWQRDLERRYARPPRAYHHLGHVAEVAEHWGVVDAAGLWRDRASTFVAVLLHDAIYEPGAPDNEARSADLAPDWCARFAPEARPARVAELIHLTARHGGLDRESVDEEARLFLDCDMAILGASPERFHRYEAEIRAEYPSLADAAFAAGRARFVERVLASRIFLSDFFHERLEDRARGNLGG